MDANGTQRASNAKGTSKAKLVDVVKFAQRYIGRMQASRSLNELNRQTDVHSITWQGKGNGETGRESYRREAEHYNLWLKMIPWMGHP